MAGVHAMMIVGGAAPGNGLYLKPNGVTIAAEPNAAIGEWHVFEGKDYYVAKDRHDLQSVVDLYKGLSAEGEVFADLTRDGQTKSIPLNQVVTTFVDSFFLYNGIFATAPSFNQLVSSWDTSNVTNMLNLFRDSPAFNQDIGGWDTSKVTDMSNIFYKCSAFNQDIGGWNTSNVTNMSNMFRNCSAFNQDIGGWDTSKVTDMEVIFYDCSAFNQDIGGWNTSNVTKMDYALGACPAFNQDISGWCVSKITKKPSGFDGGTSAAWTAEMKPKWGAPC